MSTATTKMTREEYLEFERGSELRHEFVNGEAVEMVGASIAHGIIKVNLLTWLNLHVIQSELSSQVQSETLRVFIPASEAYRYPDIVISSGEPELQDVSNDTLLNPAAIIEVLSPSTEASDRGRKFEEYRSIATLNEYILVAQDRMHVERYTRADDGSWVLTEYSKEDADLPIASIDASITLSKIYHRVKLSK